ncbi:flagellar hook-basal body complex protein FliE [Nitrosococcus wardiae]|uniref:Flagellar hook-basal body complex protein FliE n=1 Tax=Nitrosococcus wardiae TaxID=1814290 RepID=A0A4P7BX96_9GAMM|nr:flagellar hook-basal body complex protein FliE [Nitrosococcus wardiae]QBQ54621.1 flagellar hook-basal body complex protein FliE [Nitrosococcus wardiae]
MEPINSTQLLEQMRAAAALAENGSARTSGEATGNEFALLLEQALNSVNEAQQQSSNLEMAFVLGDNNVDLSEVMIASQKAGVSFQAVLQVRNRLVSAYQEIMNMQI